MRVAFLKAFGGRICSMVAINRDPTLSLYNLQRPEISADPYPWLQHLRKTDPLHFDAFSGCWICTSYVGVAELLSPIRKQDFIATPLQSSSVLASQGIEYERVAHYEILEKQVLFMDGEQHLNVRRAFNPHFTPKAMDALRIAIHKHANDLLDQMLPDGEGTGDVMSSYARPLPEKVIADMLAVPDERRDQILAWSQEYAKVLGNPQLENLPACLSDLMEYFQQAISDLKARSSSTKNLIGVLAEQMDEMVLAANCILLYAGAAETISNGIGNAIDLLQRHPELCDTLRQDAQLITPAFREALRLYSPTLFTSRLASHDTELLGQTVKEGQRIIAFLAGANRDPDQFPDPDRFDPLRSNNKTHIAFGSGGHTCLGIHLSIIEGEEALRQLLKRYRTMKIVGEPNRGIINTNLHRVEKLIISFSYS